MLARQNREGVTAESVRKQQAEWTVTVLKSKVAAKKMSRTDFNLLSFMWRTKFIKNGGKIFD